MPAGKSVKIAEGEEVDCLDKDGIWCSAIVKSVDRRKRTALVGYCGWGCEWDEWVSLSADRLAPLYTYSSASLCWVHLPRVNKWPGRVSIRRPAPGHVHAQHCLRAERKICVELFSPLRNLPATAFWIDVDCVSSFKEDAKDANRYVTALKKALEEAEASRLPALSLSFAEGTLLHVDTLMDADGKVRLRGSHADGGDARGAGASGVKRKRLSQRDEWERFVLEERNSIRYFGVRKVPREGRRLVNAIAPSAQGAAPPPPGAFLWRAFVCDEEEEYLLGDFEMADQGARVHDECAFSLRGRAARLNFPVDFEARREPTPREVEAARFVLGIGSGKGRRRRATDEGVLAVMRSIWSAGAVRVAAPPLERDQEDLAERARRLYEIWTQPHLFEAAGQRQAPREPSAEAKSIAAHALRVGSATGDAAGLSEWLYDEVGE